jgi:hypothetical protein
MPLELPTLHHLQLAAVFVVNTVLVAAIVLIHYEMLYKLATWLPTVRIKPRFRVLLGVAIIFLTHIAEIWIFALGYFLGLQADGMGGLTGEPSGHGLLLDCAYLSFITYTTVGFGDLVPHGYIRYLSGLEALTGLILVTWSASFLFLEMQKEWPTVGRGEER